MTELGKGNKVPIASRMQGLIHLMISSDRTREVRTKDGVVRLSLARAALMWTMLGTMSNLRRLVRVSMRMSRSMLFNSLPHSQIQHRYVFVLTMNYLDLADL